LAALRTFFDYVGQRMPEMIQTGHQVALIPVKRTAPTEMQFLERQELTALFHALPVNARNALRDRTLLLFLYNTGARIQEALDVCPRAIRFESPAHVELLGKGRKSRICPLWPETVDVLKALLRRQPHADDEPIFVNRYGQPLGPAGVRFKLKQYVQAAARQVPSLATKRVTPHTWRHSVGVQLVSAGADGGVGDDARQRDHRVDQQGRPRRHPVCAMQRTIDAFYGKIRQGMTGLIFFSGYGVQANRQTFLIPVDVDIWNETEVRSKGISLDNVLAEMNKRGTDFKIAISRTQTEAARHEAWHRLVRSRWAASSGGPCRRRRARPSSAIGPRSTAASR
jgi:hypothetical protein